jgi:putative ABC transport system permease protein
MWKINIKQALNYILHQKGYSLVIIIGLSVGLASSFLLYSYVFYEKSYDSFHQHGKELYRVAVTARTGGKDPYKSPYSYAPQGPVALAEIPEVESYARLLPMEKVVVADEMKEDKTAVTVGNYFYAEETFFKLFSFPLKEGDPEMVLKKPGTVVISNSLANKLFGPGSPIGKVMKVDGRYRMTVSGVFKDIPGNSHLSFDLLFSLNTFPWIMNVKDAWNNHSFFTYLLLKKGADPRIVESKLTSAYLKENRAVNQSNCTWALQPVSEAYLNTTDFTSKPVILKFGDERMVYFLQVMALLILCIAWMNYINLITAKSTERLKEIGVRKTIGAGRIQLIRQLFTESTLYNLFSIIIAIAIILTVFRWYTRTMSFSSTALHNFTFWLLPCFALLVGIILPGGISVFFSLKIKPFVRLVFNDTSRSMSAFRNGLVVLQFAIIIILMAGVIGVNKQLRYIKSVDLGFQKEQVLVLNAPRVGLEKQFEYKLATFRDEILKHSGIKDVTASVSIPGERFGYGNGGPKIKGEKDGNTYFRVGRVFPNYLNFYGTKLAAGRDFSDNMQSDDQNIIINQEAVKELGLKDADEAIEKKVVWNNREVTIVGVTQSFHQQSLHIIPEPMILYTKLHENNYNYILVKLDTRNIRESIASVESKYKDVFPNNPCDYFFLDSFYDKQYRKDIIFQKLFSLFSVIAFIIGFVGLYGVTVFRILKRTKEIGIRKVNGAKIMEVLVLLNSDFVRWILVAFIIACPIAWFAMRQWLQNFAYKTELSWWVFALAGVVAVAVAVLTVSWQSWRAATRNPVESLRYE